MNDTTGLIDEDTQRAFDAISAYYGERHAKRSGVPWINHIKEGLIILDALSATEEAKQAFCLHPMCQGDAELSVFDPGQWSPRVVMLAIEYRNIANRYLSNCDTSAICLSPLPDVNAMLVADKVQNKKDFLIYHHGKHENSDRLNEYFNQWLAALGVKDAVYNYLVEKIT